MIDKIIQRFILNVIVYEFNFEKFLYQLTIFLGIWLINPSTQYLQTFPTAVNFAPGYIWGTLCVLMGTHLRYAVMSEALQLKKNAMFGMLILWGFITFSTILSNPMSTHLPFYVLLMISIIRSYLSLAQKYRMLKHLGVD